MLKLIFLFVISFVSLSQVTTQELSIVSKTQWNGAESAAELENLQLPVPLVVIAHTASAECSDKQSCAVQLRIIQQSHMQMLHFDDIAYNFLIGNDGNVYEGRGWDQKGAVTRGYNDRSLGIGFIGTYMKIKPSERSLQAAQALIAEGVRLGKIAQDYKLLGHRQLSPTDSPGDELYDIIKQWPHWARQP